MTEITQPDVRPVKENGNLYRLWAEYKYRGFVIPEGFEYDGASIPRAVWTLTGLLPDGIHRPAALVHDWLYRNKGYATQYGMDCEYTRKFADDLFYQMLKELGVKMWHAKIAHIAVRIFGAISWKG